MKKTFWLYPLLALLLICILPGAALAHDPHDDNPIDKAFSIILNKPLNSNEYTYVATMRASHWQAEFYNIAKTLSGKYTYKEDKQKISDFVAIIDKQAETLGEIEKVNWSDPEKRPAERTYGMGVMAAIRNVETSVYRSGFFQLLENLKADPDAKYDYIYKESPLDHKPAE